MDVNEDFLLYVTCYFPQGKICEFAEGVILRKLVRKKLETRFKILFYNFEKLL